MPLFKLQKLSTLVNHGAITIRKPSILLNFLVEHDNINIGLSIDVASPIILFLTREVWWITIPCPNILLTATQDPHAIEMIVNKEAPRFYFHIEVEEYVYFWIKPKLRLSICFKVYTSVESTFAIQQTKPAIKFFLFRAIDSLVTIRKRQIGILFTTEVQEYASMIVSCEKPIISIKLYQSNSTSLSVSIMPYLLLKINNNKQETASLALQQSTPELYILVAQTENANISINTRRIDVVFTVSASSSISTSIQIPIMNVSFEAVTPVYISLLVYSHTKCMFSINSSIASATLSIKTATICTKIRVDKDTTESILDKCEILKRIYTNEEITENNSIDPDDNCSVLSFN